MENKKINQDEDLESTKVKEKTQESKLKKIGGVLKDIGNKAGEQIHKGYEWTTQKYDKIKQDLDFKNEIKKHSYNYAVVGTKSSFRAFRDNENSRLLVLIDNSDVAKVIKSESIIQSSDDNSKWVVTSIDNREAIQTEFNYKGDTIPLSVFAINIRIFEPNKDKPIAYYISNNSQNITINESTIHGNVQQINDVTQKLDVFEKEFQMIKPSLFQKKNYTEAVKIYGDVRDSIINGNYKVPAINKFAELIGAISGELLKHFSSIIE